MTKGLTIITILSIWVCSSTHDQKQLKLGTYGSYASYNLYTELHLLDSNKFTFTHLTRNAPSIRMLTGTWKVEGNYVLLEGDFNRKFYPDKYEIKGDSILCAVKELNHITCLKYTP